MKNLSSKDTKTLNEFLQVNTLSNYNTKLTKKKTNSHKFFHIDTITEFNEHKRKTFRSKLPLTSTSFYQYSSRSNKTNRKILTLKPKRLVKLYGGKIPLNLIGKANLDYKKTLYDVEVDEFEKKLSQEIKVKHFHF